MYIDIYIEGPQGRTAYLLIVTPSQNNAQINKKIKKKTCRSSYILEIHKLYEIDKRDIYSAGQIEIATMFS